jgi:hypothetical protein
MAAVQIQSTSVERFYTDGLFAAQARTTPVFNRMLRALRRNQIYASTHDTIAPIGVAEEDILI